MYILQKQNRNPIEYISWDCEKVQALLDDFAKQNFKLGFGVKKKTQLKIFLLCMFEK